MADFVSRRQMVYDAEGLKLGYCTTEIGATYAECIVPKEVLDEVERLVERAVLLRQGKGVPATPAEAADILLTEAIVALDGIESTQLSPYAQTRLAAARARISLASDKLRGIDQPRLLRIDDPELGRHYDLSFKGALMMLSGGSIDSDTDSVALGNAIDLVLSETPEAEWLARAGGDDRRAATLAAEAVATRLKEGT